MQKIFFIAIFFILFMVAPFVAKASDVFFIPQNLQYHNNDTFIKNVYIDTKDKNINVVRSEITFNPDVLEVIDIIKGESIIKLWTEEPIISNVEGLIKFSGGVPNGYKGSELVLKIIFKTKNEGDCQLDFSQTEIFLNDGKGTKDDVNIIENNCNIIEKQKSFIKIVSNSHPDENKWYNDDHFSLHWDLIKNAEYSYLIGKDSLVVPDTIADKPEGDLVWMGSMSYKGLEDGIYYFHLREKLQNEEYSQKITFRAMIDVTSPEKLFAQVTEIEGKKYLVFRAEDRTSGIDRYKIVETKEKKQFQKIKNEIDWKEVSSPYLLEDQGLGSMIKIKAVDKAGNEKEYEISPVKRTSNSQRFSPILSLFLILTITWIFLKLFRKRNKK
ncbi:MAG: hypothetical protein KAI71_01985 [Candidatus Pacebacteria bacterium]|nr:hypothetical protein [Candidatus Paceibacterota bacterium]